MSLKDAPIQKKLMAMLLLTSGAVMLFACAAFFAYEFVTFRTETVQRLSTLGRVIASNSTAALVFKDKDDAREILAALYAEPHIVAAGLYDKDGNLFSTYPANLSDDELPAKPGPSEFNFEDGHLSGFQPVIQNDTEVGTLYLKSDMSAVYESLRVYLLLIFLVMTASFIVAFALSRRLQKQISTPILSLAETATAISKRKDYTVRAVKTSNDELGLLTEAFNHMLSQIHEQNQGLRDSEERFRLMVANVQEYAIIMLDQTGNVITWNAGAKKLLGHSDKEIVGANFSRFFTAEDIDSGEPEYKIKMATNFGRVEYEGWRLRKDGSKFRANVVLTALWKDSGHLRGFCEVTRDITERKQTEDEMRRLKKEVDPQFKS
ncbi:MAG TPA: PAS domain S-box protein [candidate division Zixibacteria bacterium]|nr:PAS domain S-box protein [candidate division Zixibacteria bacterium]